jgi:hypothetical protein
MHIELTQTWVCLSDNSMINALQFYFWQLTFPPCCSMLTYLILNRFMATDFWVNIQQHRNLCFLHYWYPSFGFLLVGKVVRGRMETTKIEPHLRDSRSDVQVQLCRQPAILKPPCTSKRRTAYAVYIIKLFFASTGRSLVVVGKFRGATRR